MKLQALCRRTTWEIVRDPLNLAFGLDEAAGLKLFPPAF